MRALFQCVAVIVWLASPRIVWAGPFPRPTNPEARDHLDRGNKLYSVRKFEEAITEYEAGALTEPSAVFDYNLGQACRQLERYREALWYYERYLHRGEPTGEVREAVVAFIAEMRAHLENKAQRMPPTDPAPTPSGSTRPPTDAPPTPSDRNGPPGQPFTRVADESGVRAHDWLGWGVVGIGVTGLGIGGYLFYDASRLDDRSTSAALTQERREQLGSDAHTRRVAGTIAAGCGVALVAVGILKLALHDDREPSSATAWNITPTSNGAMLLGRF